MMTQLSIEMVNRPIKCVANEFGVLLFYSQTDDKIGSEFSCGKQSRNETG